MMQMHSLLLFSQRSVSTSFFSRFGNKHMIVNPDETAVLHSQNNITREENTYSPLLPYMFLTKELKPIITHTFEFNYYYLTAAFAVLLFSPINSTEN